MKMQIKELEEKLKQQERRLSITTIADSSSSMKLTPREEGKHKFINEAEQHILRSSNVMNRQMVAGYNRPKRTDSLGSIGGEVRRKRLSRNSEVENVEINENKSRKSDPPKPHQRGPTRTVKPAPAPVAQRPVSRPSNPIQAVKDRATKKRMWA